MNWNLSVEKWINYIKIKQLWATNQYSFFIQGAYELPHIKPRQKMILPMALLQWTLSSMMFHFNN